MRCWPDDDSRLTTGGATWAADNKTVFYTRKDEQTLRSNQVFRHVLGTLGRGRRPGV